MAVILLPRPANFENYRLALTSLGALLTEDPAAADALLLPGGGDVDPRRYGQEIDGSENIDPDRDARELALIDAFRGAGKPILGICRGHQLINVAFGGTLHQHIEGHSRIDGRDRIHASRTLDPLLTRLYGERFPVNSAHHQSVDRLAPGFEAVQWADDGTVEAMRHRTLPIFSVQWHPERLREPTDGWRLLGALLESIDARKK